MESLLTLLIGVLVIALIAYIVFWVLNQIAMPQPARAVIVGVVAIILLIFLLRFAGLLAVF